MIGRALRAQARGFAGDVVLLGVGAAALLMSLSLLASLPPELAETSDDVRDAFVAPLGTLLATNGAVLAAVYGSFRYTIDRRDGVVAQRLSLQPRWAMLLARAPASAIGGAVVALAGVVGGHVVLSVAIGTSPMDWSAALSSFALGAGAGLWGMGVGIVVQAHLVAIFVASLSMGAAMLVTVFWGAGAVYLPLPAMLGALGFDLTAVGIAPEEELGRSAAALVAVGWIGLAQLAGGYAFLNRDVH